MITRLGGKRISPLGIGTWHMGGGSILSDTKNDNADIAAIRFAIDNGVNVIDTAEMYGHGHAEELVGRAIKDHDRDGLFIITKVLPTHLGHNALKKAAMASLERMKCDYIDLYLIHWLTPGANLEVAVSAMEELVDEGVVRHIGVSNFDVKETKRAMAAAKKNRILANQVHYNLFDKSPEEELLPFFKKNKIEFIAYTPLSKGYLGKGNIEDIPEVKEISERTGRTPVQIALNYLMKRALPIPKSSNKEHLREIFGAIGWELGSKDYKSPQSWEENR